MKTARIIAVAVLIVGSALTLHVAQAQQVGARRIDLQRHDLSVPGREVVQVIVELEPGTTAPRHSHPGEEIIYVLEGTWEYTPSSEQAEAQQSTVVEAALRGGVQHIVKLSQLAAAEDSPVRFLRYHAAVERAIRASGLRYTFLRPNLFMQGFLGFLHSIIAEGKFFAAAGDAKISAIDARDIAAVAAAALTERAMWGALTTSPVPKP